MCVCNKGELLKFGFVCTDVFVIVVTVVYTYDGAGVAKLLVLASKKCLICSLQEKAAR